MNHTSKLTVLPALTTDLLQDSGILIDNVFATLWQQIGMENTPESLRLYQTLRHPDS